MTIETCINESNCYFVDILPVKGSRTEHTYKENEFCYTT